MTGKDVLPEKDFLEKAVAIKRFDDPPLGKELKKQTSVTEKHQKFDNVFESNKKEEVETKRKRSSTKSGLVYNNSFTFYKYQDIHDFVKRSLVSKNRSKIDRWKEFKYKFELFCHDTLEINPNNKEQIKDLKTALELHNQLLNILETQYYKPSKAQRKNIKV